MYSSSEIGNIQFGYSAQLLDTAQNAPYPSSLDAAVNSGSIIAFGSRMTPTQKSDVLDSTLFSYLAANYRSNRFLKPLEWYKDVLDVLGNIGWVASAFSFADVAIHGNELKVDEAVLEAIKKIATEEDLSLLQKALDALESMADDEGALAFFDSQASSGLNGNFQMGVAQLEATGVVRLCLGAFHFSVKRKSKRFLFFKWSKKDIQFSAAVQKMLLETQSYASVREDIDARLQETKKQFVWELPLKVNGG